ASEMNLRKEVSNALVARGFRRDDRVHTLRVDKDFSFLVDTGPLGKKTDIAPFVGIRHDQVQKLESELIGLNNSDSVATVSANVGYVLGQGYRWWSPPSRSAEVIQAIDAALERFRRMLSLEKLLEAWSIEGTTAPGWRYNQISVLMLLNKRE